MSDIKPRPGQVWRLTWLDEDVHGLERESFYFIVKVIDSYLSDLDTLVVMREVGDYSLTMNEYIDTLNEEYGWTLYADTEERKNA